MIYDRQRLQLDDPTLLISVPSCWPIDLAGPDADAGPGADRPPLDHPHLVPVAGDDAAAAAAAAAVDVYRGENLSMLGRVGGDDADRSASRAERDESRYTVMLTHY